MFLAILKGSITEGEGENGNGGKGTTSAHVVLVVEIDSFPLLYHMAFSLSWPTK